MKDLDTRVILDSISPYGNRITTIEATYARCIHSEMMTHRAFSRNSASSRAIPFERMLKKVSYTPFVPDEWGVNQPGMTPAPPLTGKAAKQAEKHWLKARTLAAKQAKKLAKLNVHKSYVNRLLEPFLFHTIILTSTEWSNFLAQRDHADAQREIMLVAKEIGKALKSSTPQELDFGEWHIPFIQEDEQELPLEDRIKMGVARCARVSYLNHNGKREPEADINLYNRLASQNPPHLSPFEHVCTPAYKKDYILSNFQGWNQARGLIVEGKLKL